LKKALFGITEIEGSTTADNIRDAVIDYVKFIGLNPEKIVCVVRDDAANVKNSFQCGVHFLHLVVSAFVESNNVKPVMKNAQKWARLLHQSGPAMKLYKQTQEEENVPKRILPTAISTRWNSNFAQLTELLVQRDVHNKMADANTKFNTPAKISSSDVELINLLLAVLRPFDYATKLLCQDKTTCSQLIPMISVLLNNLSNEFENPLNTAFRVEVEAMMKDCRKRLDKLLDNEFLVISSLLDPRFTVQTEALLGKQFRDYFGSFANLIKSLQTQDLLDEQVVVDDNPQLNSMGNSHQPDFWEMFGQQEASNGQSTIQREFDDQLEVNLLSRY